MGQYHILVNLDKKEYVHPHKLGAGLKLWEQIANHPSTLTALGFLLACSNGRGGGDVDDNPLVGHWAGDRIAIVGDYAERGDLASEHKAEQIYDLCWDEEEDGPPPHGTSWTDISEDCAAFIEHCLGGTFEGTGWKHWVQFS